MKKISKSMEKVAGKFAALMIRQMNEIEKDWTRPWIKVKKKNFLPQNISGRHYQGGNTMMLLVYLMFTQYRTPVFLTFRKAKELGLSVKGQHSFPVYHFLYMYFNPGTYDRITEAAFMELPEIMQADYHKVPSIKVFDVFNLDQTDYEKVYPEEWSEIMNRFNEEVSLNQNEMYRDPFLDNILNNQHWVCPFDIRLSNSAHYNLRQDRIVLPLKTQFNDGQSYYATALHEMTHSTGAEGRLNRFEKGDETSEEYAREELVAELSAALMSYYMGIESTIREDHVSYLKGWINKMKKEPDYLINVLSDVVKAVKYTFDTIHFEPFIEEISSLPKEKANVETEELVIVD
ncbi:ArdC family protein [Dysgonomonas sp. ZJ279]|uniref:ArdC family protein n=1 Tax=Dysgonomonas sp. ZJ279 TaxID=2709796 RepID=UPI0013EE1C68|nr:zincin-like metallopeptidase domain-containing protein [Dysgonomonas sp. ZJ279]